MEAGYVFNNAGMRLPCIDFDKNGDNNVVLFQCEINGMYIDSAFPFLD